MTTLEKLADTLQGSIYVKTYQTGHRIVVKEASKELVRKGVSTKGHHVPEDFLQEQEMLIQMSQLSDSHPGIVRALGKWETEEYFKYAMEYCEGGLFDYISKHAQSTKFKSFLAAEAKKVQIARKQPSQWERTVAGLFKQICESVQWMHEKGFCHLDLSLENVMIGDLMSMQTKIIDFGVTRKCTDGQFQCSRRVGKIGYMSPEVYARERYDARAADIYCLGVMLFLMLVGAPPYKIPQPNKDVAFKMIIEGRLTDVLIHWKRLSMLTEDAVDLLKRTMCYEAQRISMGDLLDHPFFAPVVPPTKKDISFVSRHPPTISRRRTYQEQKEKENSKEEVEDKVLNVRGAQRFQTTLRSKPWMNRFKRCLNENPVMMGMGGMDMMMGGMNPMMMKPAMGGIGMMHHATMNPMMMENLLKHPFFAAKRQK